MLAALAATGLLFAAAIGYSYRPVANPDPNHTHADFAVWINGKQLDFSGEEFMSGVSTDPDSYPTEGLRTYLHLHDGNGDVIHRHKPGLTLREFFESLGTTFREVAGTRNLCVDFPQIAEVCQDEAMHKDWVMVVNGERRAFDPAYVFADEDRILVYFDEDGAEDEDIAAAERALSDDACKYSKTCPWKGTPPTENCIADPTVPCVVQ